MAARFTKSQTPRGARPDAETHDKLYLLKNVSSLDRTYQIEMLAFRAKDSERKLIIRVPKRCKIGESLKVLIAETDKLIRVEKV